MLMCVQLLQQPPLRWLENSQNRFALFVLLKATLTLYPSAEDSSEDRITPANTKEGEEREKGKKKKTL